MPKFKYLILSRNLFTTTNTATAKHNNVVTSCTAGGCTDVGTITWLPFGNIAHGPDRIYNPSSINSKLFTHNCDTENTHCFKSINNGKRGALSVEITRQLLESIPVSHFLIICVLVFTCKNHSDKTAGRIFTITAVKDTCILAN